jgi:two-component system OmpR family sensor kinase
MKSFRGQLARRTAMAAGGLMLAMASLSYLMLATLLRNELDGTLRQIAEFEAGVAASTDENEFHFHEAVLLGLEDSRLPELARFAQLLDRAGNPLVRSRSLATPVDPPMQAVERAARDGAPAYRSHTSGGQDLRSLVYPIRLAASDQLYLLHVAAPTEPMRETLFAFALILVALVSLGSVLGWWLGWRGADVALHPVNEIAGQAAALGPASFATRITAHNDVAEFQQLVGVLNEMLDRLERALESQKRFTADASHELRGPLHVLRGEIDLALKRERSGDEYRDFLRRCHAEVIRLTRLSQDLLLLARADGGAMVLHLETIDLAELVEAVVERHTPLARERGVTLGATTHSVLVEADRDLLERACSNLIHNALMHTPRGTAIELTVPEGNGAQILVRDTGPGIPEAAVPMLFDRFFQGDSSRPRESGTGLGLAIARAAVEAHQGSLEFVGNAPGAVFRLVVPTRAAD